MKSITYKKILFKISLLILATSLFSTPVQAYGTNGCDKNAVFLNHFDGPNASTTSPEEDCPGDGKHPITFVGDAQLDTSQFRFGRSSLILQGSGDYLTMPDSADFDIGTNWTLDVWVRLTDVTTSRTMVLFSQYESDSQRNIIQLVIEGVGGDVLRVVTTNAGVQTIRTVTTDLALSTNTWTHLEIDKVGNDYSGFKDGVQIGPTLTESTAIGVINGDATIGARNSSTGFGNYFSGWMDEPRISITYRNKSNFPTPSTPYCSGCEQAGFGINE